MRIIAIIIINIVSLVPVLFYPMFFISGVMMFDFPSSSKSITAWSVFLLSVGYPLIIILLVFLSIRYKSFLFALLGLLPLIIILYFLFLSGSTAQKGNFNTLKKDFVCDSNSFLSLGGNESDPIRGLKFLEKKNFFIYKNDTIANIYQNKFINAQKINSKDIRDRTDQLLNSCKDIEGKTPYQKYVKIEDDQVKFINKQI